MKADTPYQVLKMAGVVYTITIAPEPTKGAETKATSFDLSVSGSEVTNEILRRTPVSHVT